MAFTLAPSLACEVLAMADLPLSRLILRDEARYPWLVLVPRVEEAGEVFDLPPELQGQLWAEVTACSAVLKQQTGCEKINIAQFGNVTRQLHVHVVARQSGDPHWPGSAIGVDARQPIDTPEIPYWWSQLTRALNTTSL